jgi:Fic family protein
MTGKQTYFFGAPDLAPHVDGSDTSEAAAAAIQPHLSALQAEILETIKRHDQMVWLGLPWPGLTCDEIEQILDMKHQTVSARILELRRKGLIEDSGERRKTRSGRKAVVWRVVK